MIRVDQTTFGIPGGNCFSACLASLLELPIDQVPYLMDHDDNWFARMQEWLAPLGLYGLMVSLTGEYPRGLYILTGRSPRGASLHSVVARGNEVIHDPHPSRAGVLSHHDGVLLVPLDCGSSGPRQLHNARLTITLLEGEAGAARQERDHARGQLDQIRALADDLEANGLPGGPSIAHLVLASRLRKATEVNR